MMDEGIRTVDDKQNSVLRPEMNINTLCNLDFCTSCDFTLASSNPRQGLVVFIILQSRPWRCFRKSASPEKPYRHGDRFQRGLSK